MSILDCANDPVDDPVDAILAEARQHRIWLSVDGEDIEWAAPSDPPEGFIERLKIYKPDIMRALKKDQRELVTWRAMVDCMKGDPPPAFSFGEWTDICAGAEAFIDTWGIQANRLGWTTADLFTVPSGLVIHLRRYFQVVAMTDKNAVIRHPAEGRFVYRRGPECST